MLRCLNKRVLLAVAASLLSGFFLACAFPLPPVLVGLEGGSAAWFALVPLLLVLPHVSPRQAAVLGWITGGIFHLIGLSWLLALRFTWGNLPLTILSWIGLVLYCSIYTAVFTFMYAALVRKQLFKRLAARIVFLFLSPLLWCGLEYFRSILFTGFPWNLLGASQYQNPVLLQPASVGGVYAISFLIVLFNTALALTVERIWHEVRSGVRGRRLHVELMVGLLALAISWSMGVRSVRQLTETAMEDPRGLHIALVQPAIPQVQKWSAEHAQKIKHALARQTEIVLMSQPDLIVWPETATPDMVRFDPASWELVTDAVAEGAFLLVGTMDLDPVTRALYNAALLVGPDEKIHEAYYKRHLVPFGEYVPLVRWFPWLDRFAPLGFSCTPGDMEQSLAPLPTANGNVAASVLICFEDVFPYLARRDVRRGAQILVNLTNDGWFDGTSAPRQHLALSVVRAVENQVPLVRSANTGVSAFVDQAGRIQEVPGYRAEGQRGSRVRGVVIMPPGRKPTLYTRFGDWLLAIPCAIGTVLLGVWIFFDSRRPTYVPAVSGMKFTT